MADTDTVWLIQAGMADTSTVALTGRYCCDTGKMAYSIIYYLFHGSRSENNLN